MFLTLSLAALIAAQADAWTPAISRALTPAYRRCLDTGDAARGVDPAMLACSYEETDRQDLRLNRAYMTSMARLPAARRAKLRTSQRAWIQRRDGICDAAYAAAGNGTASRLERSQCLLRETTSRRLWLEKQR